MNSIQRFRVLMLSLILIICIGFIPVMAEGVETEPAIEPAEVTELSVYQLDLWDYTPLFQAYVDEVNPNVEINVYSYSIDEYEDRIKIALASGDTPDLFLIPNWILPSFNSYDGIFKDMNDIDAAAVSGIKSRLAKGLWNTVNPTAVDTVSFVPLNSSPQVMFYRTDLFKKAGLPTKPETIDAKLKTWSAFASYGKTFKTKTKKALIAQPINIYESMVQLKAPIYHDDQGNYVGDKNPQIKKAYDYVVKGMKEGWIGKYEDYTPSWEKALKAGNFGVVLGDPSTAQDIKEWMPKLAGKWAVASVPEGSYDTGLLSAAIPSGNQNSESVMDGCEWMTETGPQNWIFNEYGLFPANVDALGEKEWLDEKDAYFGNQQVNRWYAKAVQTAKPDLLYRDTSVIVHGIFNNAIANLLASSKADPAKEWSAAGKEAKQVGTN